MESNQLIREDDIFERVPYTTREEWLKLRGRGIGGSDAAVILGYSSWKNNYQLWEEKVRSVDEELEMGCDDEETNECIEYGRECEDAIRTLFHAKFINFLEVTHTNEQLVRKDKPYLRASLDGELLVLQDFDFISYDGKVTHLKAGMRGILEIKTKLNPTKDEWKTGVPTVYLCQGTHYINVTRYDFIIYVGELRYTGYASSYIRAFCYDRTEIDDSDLKYLEQKEDEFWEKVQAKKEVNLLIKF